MCKKNFRKNLYNCALLYKKGLLSDEILKKCLADYTIEIIKEDLYKQLNKYSANYEKELNYAR